MTWSISLSSKCSSETLSVVLCWMPLDLYVQQLMIWILISQITATFATFQGRKSKKLDQHSKSISSKNISYGIMSSSSILLSWRIPHLSLGSNMLSPTNTIEVMKIMMSRGFLSEIKPSLTVLTRLISSWRKLKMLDPRLKDLLRNSKKRFQHSMSWLKSMLESYESDYESEKSYGSH